jgi:hypothetical protein
MKSLKLLLFLAIGWISLPPSAKADCIPPFTWTYTGYHSESTDGTYIYESATIDGSATMAPPQCWYQQGTPLHTPGVQNQIKNMRTGVTVGGWTYGSGQCVTCYIQQTNNQNVLAGTDTFQVTEQGTMTCSMGRIVLDMV